MPELPRCPDCNKPIPEDAPFCPQCGHATPTSMTKDGEVVDLSSGNADDAEFEQRLDRALGEQYQLGERIGVGGFGAVYRARDTRLKRDVAVKVMRADLASNPELRDRFQREAESVAALRHPNILPIYSIGESEGLVYFLMPLIEGQSLADLLEEETPPLDESRRIVAEIASALAEAHRAGLVHRDIKPDNILLEGPQRRALVMDFGIAKAIDSGSTKLTATGMIVGTPQFMSPEQAAGDEDVDHRTDIYSLGVMAYQMFAGAPLFEGTSARSVIIKHISTRPDDLAEKQPSLPREVAAAVMRCLEKEPADRWDDADDFAAEVRTPGATGEIATTPKKKKLGPLAGIAAVVVVVLGVVFWPDGPAPEPVIIDTLPALPETMAEIPSGDYVIGTDAGNAMSRPAHTVTLSPYGIERTEVTRGAYREFLGSAEGMGFDTPPDLNEGDDLPVTGVFWDEASAYCGWRHATGRLPTEEEWEAAARNTAEGVASGPTANIRSTGVGAPVSVGSYPAGATEQGVLDMIGNVWEWTSSRIAPYPGGSPIDVSGIHYVIRGGAFNAPDDVATATRRGYLPATMQDRSAIAATGFRCSMSLPGS